MARVTDQSATVPTRDGYDRWAEVYDGDGNPLLALEAPVFARLAGDVAGRDVLDVGCGTGRHSLQLAALGAHVTAVDFSPGMLARARAKPGAARVHFVEHDLGAALPFAACAFDLVTCALVLDHVHDLTRFFGELRRVCRDGGRVVATTMHPAMMLKGVQARFIDPASGERVLVDSAAHTTADYVNAVLAAGLGLLRLEEHALDARTAAAYPRGAPHVGWPMLLALALAR